MEEHTYDPQAIEAHWQQVWEDTGLYRVDLDRAPRPFFNLMEFPYPSGEGLHVGMDTTNSLIYSNGKLVATIGLENMIVVDTGDALLVLPKDRAQDVSTLVKELRARGLEDYL